MSVISLYAAAYRLLASGSAPQSVSSASLSLSTLLGLVACLYLNGKAEGREGEVSGTPSTPFGSSIAPLVARFGLQSLAKVEVWANPAILHVLHSLPLSLLDSLSLSLSSGGCLRVAHVSTWN
ncbi:hypothetical protein KIPB_000305 [Kipferlia bialata]|uniref:Uncharacterized protein n=1 Tax=Kipferlia bialata TaxID=797122 RepID=A0A9K3GEK5_9EUKA|nr:hypothetical protein KIPB_000305 [Kipferlia bialata]|eukprot:g305.t1